VVQLHRQAEALFFGEEGVDVEHAELAERRFLYLEDHVFERQVLPAPPGVLEDVGDQHVLAVFDRLDVLADQRQQRGDDPADLLAVELVVARLPAPVRRAHSVHDADRQAGVGAGRVDAEMSVLLEGGDALRGDIPACQPIAPFLGDFHRVVVDLQPGAARIVDVDPRREIFRLQVREGQQQVGNVALRIDNDRGDVVQHGLFEQRDAQAGLAAAGHADDDGVRCQVARVIIDHLVDHAAGGGVEAAAKVKRGGSFDKWHGVPCLCGSWFSSLSMVR